MLSQRTCLMWLRIGRRNKAVYGCLGFLFVMLLYHLFIQEPKAIRSTKIETLLPNPSTDDVIHLVILVMTGPKNKDRRNTMRNTWLSQSKEVKMGDVQHYFVIGTKNLPASTLVSLKEEQFMHHDLLLLTDFEDAYEKLTQKLALMFEWLDQNLKYNYVFKVDDDTFALLDPIIKELNRFDKKKQSNLYWGYFYGRGRIKRKGPWKETNWKLCDYYLPYARGGGYILSSQLVNFVAKNWKEFQMYHSEDVSLGAWLSPLKLNRFHDARFDTEYKSRGCKNAFIVCHKQSIKDMNDKFSSLKSSGQICRKETVLFHGYNYNWDVPPSQCCERSAEVP